MTMNDDERHLIGGLLNDTARDDEDDVFRTSVGSTSVEAKARRHSVNLYGPVGAPSSYNVTSHRESTPYYADQPPPLINPSNIQYQYTQNFTTYPPPGFALQQPTRHLSYTQHQEQSQIPLYQHLHYNSPFAERQQNQPWSQHSSHNPQLVQSQQYETHMGLNTPVRTVKNDFPTANYNKSQSASSQRFSSTTQPVPIATVNPISYAGVASKRPNVGVATKMPGNVANRKGSARESVSDAAAPVKINTQFTSGSPSIVKRSPIPTQIETVVLRSHRGSGSNDTPPEADDSSAGQQTPAVDQFQKIANKKGKKKGATKSKQSHSPEVAMKMRVPPNQSTTFHAQLVESENGSSRFQPLADANNRQNNKSSNKQLTNNADVVGGRKSESKTRKAPATATKSSVKDQSSCNRRGTVTQRNKKNQNHQGIVDIAFHHFTFVILLVWQLICTVCSFLHNLISEILFSLFDIGAYSLQKCTCNFREQIRNCLATIGRWFKLLLTRKQSAATNVAFNAEYDAAPWYRKCWRLLVYYVTFQWIWKHDEIIDDLGLPENIDLPQTGDEAISRLMKCAGRDAYSVLGLRHDCQDDDIKKYYRRQAVLVHPDKNYSPGADEAFKILQTAFECIETPEQRREYNITNLHRRADVRQFQELIEQLRARIEEALNTMPCDCGKRHRRYKNNRRTFSARYCNRCNDYHAAKENDIWAESRLFGLVWSYFCVINGQVYDITEWADCSRNRLKHIKVNNHDVQYKLSSQIGDGTMPQSNSSNSPSFAKHDCSVNVLLEKLSHFANENQVGADAFSEQPTRTAQSSNAAAATYQPPERNSSRPGRATHRRRKK